MKKIYLFAITIAGAVCLNACSSQFHPVINQNLLQTQVVLSQRNFKVVGRVEGSHTTTRIFGIGGLSKKAMQDNAISIMFQNADITASQAIVNISFMSAIAGVPPFYTETTYTATGTIIEFVSDSDLIDTTANNIQPNQSTQVVKQPKDTKDIKKKKSSQTSKTDTTTKLEELTEVIVNIKGVTYTEGDEVEYNGVKTKIVKIENRKITLAIDSQKAFTWDDAMAYSKSIGSDWNLPTQGEFKSIHNNIEPYYYWTCTSTHPQTALYYNHQSRRCYSVIKNRNFYTLLIKSVSIDDLQ